MAEWRVSLLLLSMHLSALFAGCPLRCNCTENSVLCISSNLEYVPYFENLSNNPAIIDLSGNQIQLVDIDDFSFDKSDQVKEIYMNNSELVSIEERAFEELESLQELYLADNLLSTLPELLIEMNEFMILLDISSNHFVEMPKLKSESLEVLAIANSRVSRIGNDALDGLPNLRVLLLQQNNLKQVDPVIFQNTPELFFVKTEFNPWRCSCKTVKFFDYLTSHSFIDDEVVECQTENKDFIRVYNEDGLTNTFKEQCGSKIVLNDDNEITDDKKIINLMDILKNLNTTNGDYSDISFVPEEDSDTYFNMFAADYFYACLLALSIFLSLIIGAAMGSYVTYRHMSFHIRNSESTKELLGTGEFISA